MSYLSIFPLRQRFNRLYGCFQKSWYPQIIHFNRVFHYKPSILGYPYIWNPPYSSIYIDFFCCQSRCFLWFTPFRLRGKISNFSPGPRVVKHLFFACWGLVTIGTMRIDTRCRFLGGCNDRHLWNFLAFHAQKMGYFLLCMLWAHIIPADPDIKVHIQKNHLKIPTPYYKSTDVSFNLYSSGRAGAVASGQNCAIVHES